MHVIAKAMRYYDTYFVRLLVFVRLWSGKQLVNNWRGVVLRCGGVLRESSSRHSVRVNHRLRGVVDAMGNKVLVTFVRSVLLTAV